MHHDALVIGGSFAGLTAATYIARARRSVCVVDTGAPRNRSAEHSHGLFGQDGRAPSDMIADARTQLGAYPTVTFVDGHAVHATKTEDGFAVTLKSGDVLTAKRLVLAFGISDRLPDVPGIAERWGRSVLHCPYCHGYEFGGRRLGVLYLSPMSVHQAQLIPEWGPTTFFSNGDRSIDEAALDELRSRGVTVETAPVEALRGDGSNLSEIALTGGRTVPLDALFIGARTFLNSPIAEQLGCEMEDGPLGPFLRTDPMKMTTVPGVYAAGDITRAMHNITWACADGVMAGTAVHRSLIF